LTTREIADGGFGLKVRAWNDRVELMARREQWAAIANRELAVHGFPACLDHRSYAERGIDLEPRNKIGDAALRRARAGEAMERVDERAAIERGTPREARHHWPPGQLDRRRAPLGGAPRLTPRLVVVGRLAEVGLVVERQLEGRRKADGDGDLDGRVAGQPRDEVLGCAADAAGG